MKFHFSGPILAAVLFPTVPAAAQPTGCVVELGHLPVNSALIQGEPPVVRDGILYHVISTNPSGTEYQLIAVDITDPTSPHQVASVAVPNDVSCGMPAAIALEGTELYVLTSSGLSLFDVSSPASPTRMRTLSSVELPCGGVNPGLALNERALVVLSGAVFVVDRALMRQPPSPPPAPPNNPVVRVLSLAGGVPQDVAVHGDTAVVSTFAGLYAIDIATPASSFVRETMPLPGFPGTLAFDEYGRLFVACGTTDHLIANVNPFSTPIPLTGVGTYSVLGIAASRSRYATCSATSGAFVYRVSGSQPPTLRGTSSPFFCEALVFVGEMLITASRDAGIRLFDVSGCLCPADFNGDSGIDFFDYLDFVAAWDAELPAADLNADGTIDFFDYLDFVAAFDAGC